MAGGVAEYLSLITGYRWLTAIIALCYIGALFARQWESTHAESIVPGPAGPLSREPSLR